MTLFALPGAAVLIVRVSRFDFFEARGADEDPVAVFVDANAVTHVVRFGASRTGFGADAFDLRHHIIQAAIWLGTDVAHRQRRLFWWLLRHKRSQCHPCCKFCELMAIRWPDRLNLPASKSACNRNSILDRIFWPVRRKPSSREVRLTKSSIVIAPAWVSR